MSHEYEEEPEMSRVTFVNGRDWDDAALNVSTSSSTSSRQFGAQPVNLNTSAVHLPTQVYEGCESSIKFVYRPLVIFIIIILCCSFPTGMWHRFKPIWYEGKIGSILIAFKKKESKNLAQISTRSIRCCGAINWTTSFWTI